VDWVTIIGISMVVQMFSAIVIGSLSDPFRVISSRQPKTRERDPPHKHSGWFVLRRLPLSLPNRF
jgi:hypothetical protein